MRKTTLMFRKFCFFLLFYISILPVFARFKTPFCVIFLSFCDRALPNEIAPLILASVFQLFAAILFAIGQRAHSHLLPKEPRYVLNAGVI